MRDLARRLDRVEGEVEKTSPFENLTIVAFFAVQGGAC